MDQGMWLQYPASIDKIIECNESFDACTIRICYTGKNRNKSSISKKAIEDAIPSIYNCPIVCNYNVNDDSLGGHDVEIVSTSNGMRIINLTDAIGVVPYNCNYYWETINDNGVDHEYFCIEAILWKRSSAYFKIKRDGIVSQSMEITVKNGQTIDGVYQIEKFIFTAFCLLGEDVEPCFESAALETFSLQQYKQKFSEMMEDFKTHFSRVDTSNEVDIHIQNLSKGGNIPMDKMELLSEFGLTVEDLDFSIENFSIEELRVKFEAMRGSLTGQVDGVEQEGCENGEKDFSLTGEQFLQELYGSLGTESFVDPCWGEMCRYLYIDYSLDESEVYCYDCEDWNIYGFKYSMNGDNVVVDFSSKKRKKISFVDFVEGDSKFTYKDAFEAYAKSVAASKDAEILNLTTEAEEKFNDMKHQFDEAKVELIALKQYKADKLNEERLDAEEKLFAGFSELNGIEAFEALKSDCSGMSLEDIESKCFEIKGRNNVVANFSLDKPKTTRIGIERHNPDADDEPYGGIFKKYAPKNN